MLQLAMEGFIDKSGVSTMKDSNKLKDSSRTEDSVQPHILFIWNSVCVKVKAQWQEGGWRDSKKQLASLLWDIWPERLETKRKEVFVFIFLAQVQGPGRLDLLSDKILTN